MKLTKTETGGENWWFWCPGCNSHHLFTTKRGPNESGPIWDKTPDELTFSPSLLCNGNITKEDLTAGMHRCHLFLKKGMVQYLSDCTHTYKNKTIPVEEPCF